MGAYNVVTIDSPCIHCAEKVPVRVQFKYGDARQHEYSVGDSLRWGGNDIGESGHRRVVVDGVGERCPRCRYDGERNFYVFVENDVIKAVEPASNRYDFATIGQTYIVLEE
jgi:hypothetical protein